MDVLGSFEQINPVASRQKVLWFRVSIRSLRNWKLVGEAAVVFRPTLKDRVFIK
jgi:hypothetical protein